LHPISLPPSPSLPSLFLHSLAFLTFDQKKRLVDNEPERKGPRRSRLSRRGPGRESQGEGAKEKEQERRAKAREKDCTEGKVEAEA